jgi:hypothetical protein
MIFGAVQIFYILLCSIREAILNLGSARPVTNITMLSNIVSIPTIRAFISDSVMLVSFHRAYHGKLKAASE